MHRAVAGDFNERIRADMGGANHLYKFPRRKHRIHIMSGSACQAFGYSVYSMLISIARQIVVLIPAAYLLSLSGVLRSVWFAFPIAEIFSLILSLFFLRTTLKKTGMAMPKTK